jgi:hypothetical protein
MKSLRQDAIPPKPRPPEYKAAVVYTKTRGMPQIFWFRAIKDECKIVTTTIKSYVIIGTAAHIFSHS